MPVSDTYVCASGARIRAGRGTPWPAWRRAMSPGTWRTIPAAAKLSALDPAANPAINPNYPSVPEWQGTGGQACVISKWCGACYDRTGDVLWLPLGGGHGDYGGNEPYRIDISGDTPSWEMLRPPSGAIGNLLATQDGQEATGVYSDGRPRAVHSYGKPVYAPGVGPMMCIHGTSTAYGANGGNAKALRFSEATGECTFLADNPYAGLGGGGEYSGGCYDPSRHCLWWLPSYNGAAMTKYDIAGNTWSQVGAGISAQGSTGMCYLPDDDCILALCASRTNGLAVFDCAAGTWHTPGLSGSLVGSISLTTDTDGSKIPTWVPDLGGAALWDNATETAQINLLAKPANPRTGTWTISQLPVAAANTVTPTARSGVGTWGRFQYAPNLDGFVLLNAANQDLYFYAKALP